LVKGVGALETKRDIARAFTYVIHDRAISNTDWEIEAKRSKL
jgi:hypothetical protein